MKSLESLLFCGKQNSWKCWSEQWWSLWETLGYSQLERLGRPDTSPVRETSPCNWNEGKRQEGAVVGGDKSA